MPKLKDRIRNAASAGLALVALCTSAATGAPTATPTIHGNVIEGVSNARYCEIIPIVRDGLHQTATVYNTLGLNDCPAQIWDKISEDAMKQRFDAVTVLLNGPRYFLMDSIEASGTTEASKKIDAGGLDLTERATIDVGLLDLLHRYREQTINRDTVYRFKAGLPVFMIEAADGRDYAMQAYSQIVNKTLNYDDLATLGPRLKLPSGWRYTTMTPDQDLVLGAQGATRTISMTPIRSSTDVDA